MNDEKKTREKRGRRGPRINGLRVGEIARMTGLHDGEVSLALSAKRLLRRNKLKQIYEAGLPIEPFVFGEQYYKEMMMKEEG